MSLRACEWAAGCNRGGFREVDTAPIGEPGKRWLCLHHAGSVWNARKQANRAAGRCPCGAAVTPGYRTCARCRAQGRRDRKLSRNLAKLARATGIEAPREPGRRRALRAAFSAAFRRASRERDRRYRAMRRSARSTFRGWCDYERGGEIAVSATSSWEGHPIAATSRVRWNVRRCGGTCGEAKRARGVARAFRAGN